MRRTAFLLTVIFIGCKATKQIEHAINVNDVQRIEATLSHDSMQGRRTFTPGIEKAAAFIANEMKQTGLEVLAGADGYLQNFEMVKPTVTNASITVDENR